MKKLSKAVLVGGVAAAALAATVGVAAPANARSWHYTKTMVQWGGSSCINVQEANVYGYSTYCGFGNAWELNETPYVGQNLGLDPIMGNASWISCQVYVDGRLDYSDFASAGDGTDVNCTRSMLW